MNPEQVPIPQHNFEPSPQINKNSEFTQSQEKSTETFRDNEQGSHRFEREGTPPQGSPSDAAITPTVVPVPVPQIRKTDSVSPTIAKDDDLIEKEWVKKAEEIIHTTPNDPHEREKQVSQLQVDYLRKRYGKELGTSN
jgi:hypothetical protein